MPGGDAGDSVQPDCFLAGNARDIPGTFWQQFTVFVKSCVFIKKRTKKIVWTENCFFLPY